jgi:translocation and assembly module TamA
MKKLAANMTVLLLMIGMMVAIPAHAFIGTNLKITFKDQQCTKACQNHIQKLVNEHLAINKSEFKINPQPALESYINKAMRAEGYYNSTTMISVDKYTNNITEILITAGNILTFGALNYTSSIDSHLSIKELYLPSLTSLGLKTGQAGQAYKVISAVDAITAHINKNYCLFHVKVEHEAIIDNLTNQLHVNFIITTGPRSVFGETKFEGANSFSAIFLKKLLPWKEGVCFKQEQLQKAQIELLQHDYFSTAFIKLPKTVAPNGKIPITIHVKELPSRTVKIGLNYSSDLGPGIQLITSSLQEKN